MRYGHTIFDYALNWVWDIKVHTEIQTVGRLRRTANPEMLLNDEVAVMMNLPKPSVGALSMATRCELTTSSTSTRR